MAGVKQCQFVGCPYKHKCNILVECPCKVQKHYICSQHHMDSPFCPAQTFLCVALEQLGHEQQPGNAICQVCDAKICLQCFDIKHIREANRCPRCHDKTIHPNPWIKNATYYTRYYEDARRNDDHGDRKRARLDVKAEGGPGT